jgi:hypothetical protein
MADGFVAALNVGILLRLAWLDMLDVKSCEVSRLDHGPLIPKTVRQ